MIIDFHAHVFPDKVAPHVLRDLKTKGGLATFSDGTVGGLASYMDGTRLDYVVAMGVAIRPDLVQRTNDWLMGIKDRRVIPFGSVHPDYPDPAAEIDRLRQNGIKGLKLHPLFQLFRPDEKRMMPIYEAMGDDMIAFFHAGAGLSTGGKEVLATPSRIGKVIKDFPNLKVVAAHFGGYKLFEEAERCLAGRDLYFDTSWPPGLNVLDADAVVRVIRKHGYEKIVFGSDSPTADAVAEIQCIDSLQLNNAEKEAILGGNACTLLGLGD
ncbi:MAG: amidohydrolase family protein [Proteobacteria bacterium]|nr:amidohydrolase family protein [Pseudomonadota bacterium]